MSSRVIDNEIYLAAGYIRSKSLIQGGVCVMGEHKLCDYLIATSEYLGSAISRCDSADAIPTDCKRLWYVAQVDSAVPNKLGELAALCAARGIELTAIILISNIKSNPTIRAYAEMELLTAMSPTLSPIREALRGKGAKALFLDRLFGAEFDGVGLRNFLSDISGSGAVTIGSGDALRFSSALYISDAITAAYTVSEHGKSDNIYNATSCYGSDYQFKSAIYMLLARHGIKLKVTEDNSAKSYSAISCGKLSSLGYEACCDFADALRYTVEAYTDRWNLHSDYIAESYNGKLSGLRELQKEMLREIDRICRKHDIPYFLSGGSMLGAVRHGGYIPWDDDIDIAMLVENYDRFREIVPKELSDRFSYQTFTNRDGYHFFFDRITAKDTYFASQYSDGYEMAKGISVDIFVYDNVPDSKRIQHMHWRKLMNKRMVMNVRWKDTARKGKMYSLSKLVLPVLRLRSMDSYSASYDKATHKYKNINAEYVMAPATDHSFRDAMPREWFTETVPCTFEGIETFLPKGYDGFLRNWYGDDYMTMLPISEQRPYHDYYRLDLGSHIVENSKMHFDFLGELK